MVKKTKNNALFKIISASIDEFKIIHANRYSVEELNLKKCSIRSLCVNEHFDNPTQGLLNDWIESFSTSDLIYLNLFGERMQKEVIPAPIKIDQECHAMSALNWFLNETLGEEKDKLLHIYTGVSDKTHHHSWLYDETRNVILEPTCISRDEYFGYKVADPFRFFVNELNSIYRLIESKVIPESVATYFQSEFDKHFKPVAFSHKEYLQR